MRVSLSAFSMVCLLACGADDPAGVGGGGAGGDGGGTCDPVVTVCTPLFGRPNDATGLTDAQCAPRLTCDGQSWEPPAYDAAFVAALRAYTLIDPPTLLEADPYEAPAAPLDEATVCGALFDEADPDAYRLETFGSEDAAIAAGARVTHFGPCGLCSSLTDLAVYIEQEDLTEPVRACGLAHLSGPPEEHLACLAELGFTEACAQIWYFNTRHTRAVCAEPCFAALGQPYHLPDGNLNACLVCDEEQSGPVFKAVAGRTRRNTGLANAMCRPCEEVQPLVHAYP